MIAGRMLSAANCLSNDTAHYPIVSPVVTMVRWTDPGCSDGDSVDPAMGVATR